MSITLTSSSLVTKTTDNSQNLMFLINVEETINLDIQVGEQTKPKNNTITMTSETTKSEAEVSETVKLEAEKLKPVKPESATSQPMTMEPVKLLLVQLLMLLISLFLIFLFLVLLFLMLFEWYCCLVLFLLLLVYPNLLFLLHQSKTLNSLS